MDVGIVVTNYNNSDYTIKLLNSLRRSEFFHKFRIVVVDNASRPIEYDLLEKDKSSYQDFFILSNSQNVGYFSGLSRGVSYLKSKFKLDILIVGNNDLEFPSDFYINLMNSKDLFDKYEVVCPDIITLDNVHQYPHIRSGVSNFREMIWSVYYSNFFVSRFVLFISKITNSFTKRSDTNTYDKPGIIYQGYGACYILTNKFFEKGFSLWSPCFLMGEEYFLYSELKSKNGLQFYNPEIKVTHVDHATCSKVPSKIMWGYSKTAFVFYRNMRENDDLLL